MVGTQPRPLQNSGRQQQDWLKTDVGYIRDEDANDQWSQSEFYCRELSSCGNSH